MFSFKSTRREIFAQTPWKVRIGDSDDFSWPSSLQRIFYKVFLLYSLLFQNQYYEFFSAFLWPRNFIIQAKASLLNWTELNFIHCPGKLCFQKNSVYKIYWILDTINFFSSNFLAHSPSYMCNKAIRIKDIRIIAFSILLPNKNMEKISSPN